MKHNILLIGAGPMAVEYAKVLDDLSVPYSAVGRSEISAKTFAAATGKPVATGGFQAWLLKNNVRLFSSAIIAVGERQLGREAIRAMEAGCKRILVEKPGAYDYEELVEVKKIADKNNAHIFLGYNRRYYASVMKALDMINDDGGVTSFQFEFTEWSHKIGVLKKEEGVLSKWFYHNSSHVIDMAFFLGGKPSELSCYTTGSLPWHPQGSCFYGAGKTETGALFSYSSNWEAPGRWGVEVCTKKQRYIFRPLEALQAVEIGSVAVNTIEIEDALDKRFKPGLYAQTRAFIFNEKMNSLCTLAEQIEKTKIYQAIENGTH